MASKEDFPELTNDLLLQAATGHVTKSTPIWVMRQAGRYLPEFREVRAASDFFTVCRTPALAAEVTLQPIRRFDLDGSIIFCDILVIPQAMGMKVDMVPGKGPVFETPLEEPACLEKLQDVDISTSLGYLMEAITLTRHELKGKVPLIGFCGAPWTLMAYMIEGSGSKTFSKAKTWLYRWPDASHALLTKLTDICIPYLVAQARAGAQLLKVFDSWAGELSPDLFDLFIFPYLERIAREVKQTLRDAGEHVPPMIVFAKGIRYGFTKIAFETEYDVMALDWQTSPEDVRAQLKGYREEHGNDKRVCLQGNLDPCVLYGGEEVIKREVAKVLDGFRDPYYPHIFNLGHGMHPTHLPEMMEQLVNAVHSLSSQ